MDGQQSSPVTLYEAVGGASYFEALVGDFYSRVEADALLRPLYPDDLRASTAHTALFLMQYWGGPGTYSERRGHPRLRMRHAPFSIGLAERNAWFEHMAAAVADSDAIDEAKAMMLQYFDQAATAMINRVE
jgi:hemoglobin